MAGQRLDRRHQGLAARALALALGLATGACAAPPPPPPGAVPLDVVVAGRGLAGAWEWVHFEIVDGTMVRERELWRFTATDDPRRLAGFLRRDVLVRSFDTPFECNQRLRYRQRATIAFTADVTPEGIHVVEKNYDAEPSPCDPGLRRLGDYTATLHGDRLALVWDGGDAELHRVPLPPPAPAPPLARAPAGRWSWRLASWTKAGLVRYEDEDWELAVGDDGALAGTYTRAVTVRSPDNQPLPCAGAPSYSFVDRYLVRGTRTTGEAGDGWRIEETAVRPGSHPCLAATADRTLDAATITADGDYLVLSWRGKRRQVLARPLAE